MTQIRGPYRIDRLQDRQLRMIVLMTALLLHAIGLWALTQMEAGRRLLAEITPILVSVIEQKPPPPAPKPPEPKPRREPPPPQPRPAAAPPPILAAESVAIAPAPAYEVPVPKAGPVGPAPNAGPAAQGSAEAVVPPNFSAAYLNNPPPGYPAASRRFGEQGRVMLRVLVDARGDAEKIEVSQTSGHTRLDQAAVDAVQRWKFVPAKRGDTAVGAWVLVPIAFKLGD
jgi:protein TonB